MRSPARLSTFWLAGTGPQPMISGSTPATAVARIVASTGSPSSFARSRVMSSTAAAPSLICEELPAVTCPPSLKDGTSVASFSSVVSPRGPWSRSAVPPAGRATGTSSSLKRPSSWAATARWFERRAKRSESSRLVPLPSALLARLVGAADDDILDGGGIEAPAREARPHAHDAQVVSANVLEDALLRMSLPEGGADGVDHHDFAHGLTSSG